MHVMRTRHTKHSHYLHATVRITRSHQTMVQFCNLPKRVYDACRYFTPSRPSSLANQFKLKMWPLIRSKERIYSHQVLLCTSYLHNKFLRGIQLRACI